MAKKSRPHSKYRPPHPPVVYVEWHDSRSLTSQWADRQRELAEADRLYHETIASVGFLLRTHKKYVVIGLGIAPVDDIMHSLIIPRSEIKLMKKVMSARGMEFVKDGKARA